VKKQTSITLYVILIIAVFATIFIVWAIDTGRLGTKADVVGPSIESASELKQLPNPDQSTFSKIFGAILRPFTK